MKAKLKKKGSFEPIHISLTIESKEELQALFTRLAIDENTLTKPNQDHVVEIMEHYNPSDHEIGELYGLVLELVRELK